MRVNKTNRTLSAEAKAKIAATHRGVKRSPETRIKMSLAQRAARARARKQQHDHR
jgi:hypothetical protein